MFFETFFFVHSGNFLLYSYFRYRTYHKTPEERKATSYTHRIGVFYNVGFAAVVVSPFIFAKNRRYLTERPHRLLLYTSGGMTGVYFSNIISKSPMVSHLLSIDDSAQSYTIYTLMMNNNKYNQNKIDYFYKKYNLKDFELRYNDFSLSKAMEPRLEHNWDPIFEDFTPRYKEFLRNKKNLTEFELKAYRERFRHDKDRIMDETETYTRKKFLRGEKPQDSSFEAKLWVNVTKEVDNIRIAEQLPKLKTKIEEKNDQYLTEAAQEL